MRVKLVTLQYAPALGGFDARPLDEFIRDKQVLAVREHFFVVHELPHMACLATYLPVATESPTASRGAREKRPDPAAELPDADRTLFQSLREWRAARARKEGIPAYVILTNREMVEVVRARPETASALGAIDGIGEGKVERYGQAILERLNGTGAS